MISWVHFGDLHASQDDDFGSLRDLEMLVSDVNGHMTDLVDFVFLPGDNANNGSAEQYRHIRDITQKLSIPLHIIPGDHDFEPGSLDAFHQALGAEPLPKAVHVDGRRCLFLDIVSPGKGGPDFVLGNAQMAWLKKELRESAHDRHRPLVFMHAFPGDLAEGGEEVAALFHEHKVAFVDTGHTHYNELLNDGSVIYAATRSTGQIEEGPPGFSVAAVDGTAASWRFKALDESWPFLLITSPADHRLITDPTAHDQVVVGPFTIRAKIFGTQIQDVRVRLGEEAAIPMHSVAGERGAWAAEHPPVGDGLHTITVEATGDSGVQARDTVLIRAAKTQPESRSLRREGLGTDHHSVGAWPEHGILGTQLGPNKNGKKW